MIASKANRPDIPEGWSPMRREDLPDDLPGMRACELREDWIWGRYMRHWEILSRLEDATTGFVDVLIVRETKTEVPDG